MAADRRVRRSAKPVRMGVTDTLRTEMKARLMVLLNALVTKLQRPWLANGACGREVGKERVVVPASPAARARACHPAPPRAQSFASNGCCAPDRPAAALAVIVHSPPLASSPADPQQHPTGNDCGPARWRARSQSLALAPGRAGGDNRLLTLARRVCSPADGDGRRAKRLSRRLTGLSYKGGHDETLGQTSLFPSDPKQIDTPFSNLSPHLTARKPPSCLTPSPKHGPLLYLPRLNSPRIENGMSGHIGTRQTLEVRNDYDYDVGV
jgi:hypothetical protein